jgi:pyruvate dehydrogenase E2 component (dihydrolipoamide acetyltransferase)
MSIEFKLPDLGEGIHEAEILQVKVAEGDRVKEDQPIFEVETDKAVVEIPCPVEGTVEKIHVKAGEVVTVGKVMITFGVAAGGAKAPAAEKQKATAAAESSTRISAPPVVPSVASGSDNGRSGSHRPVPCTPATRRMAREMGVDVRMVHGSGPAGRVTKEDIRAFAEGVPSAGGSVSTQAQGAPVSRQADTEPGIVAPLVSQPVDLPDFQKYGPIERVPLRSIRRKIAQNMAQSWSHIPHVTHMDECDITELDEFRAKHEKEVQAKGGRLTLTVFMIKAVVSALKKYPEFNSSLDEKTGEIIYKRYYNIGIAVATERGLIVPVIKNADQKNLTELAIELGQIAQKTREGKVELDRLQGGTFTITNLGSIGGTGMVPMVNFPEAAILGMARGSQKPVIRDGELAIRLILPLAMSFDHRIADGAEAAYFVRHVADCMEEPLKLLLEG